jgi:uncharacterized protein (DUF302 family)
MKTIMLSVRTPGTVEPVVEELERRLGEEGFTAFARVDLRARLWERAGKEVSPAVLLDLFCPPLTYEAFSAQPEAAALLACQAVVRDGGGGSVCVELVRPTLLLGALGDERLAKLAAAAEQRLQRALESLPPAPSPAATPSAQAVRPPGAIDIIGPCSTPANPASSLSS